MASLTVTKTYSDTNLLSESNLDSVKTSLEAFFNTTKISDDNLKAAGITASSKLITASISTAKIASSAITTAKIADDAITTAKIVDDAILTAKIADETLGDEHIPTSNVTYAKLTRNYTVSSSSGASGAWSTGEYIESGGIRYCTITNLSVTLTTSGGNVLIILSPTYGTNLTKATFFGELSGAFGYALFRDSTLRSDSMKAASGGFFVDNPAAGSYTYSFRGVYIPAIATPAGLAQNLTLIAIEL